jgi:hypothetical protein
MHPPLPQSPWFREEHVRPMERNMGLGFALAVHQQTKWPLHVLEMVDQGAIDRGAAPESVLRVPHRLIAVSPKGLVWDVRGVFNPQEWGTVIRAIVSRQTKPEPWVERGYGYAAPMVMRTIGIAEAVQMAPPCHIPLTQALRLAQDRVDHSAALQLAISREPHYKQPFST